MSSIFLKYLCRLLVSPNSHTTFCCLVSLLDSIKDRRIINLFKLTNELLTSCVTNEDN